MRRTLRGKPLAIALSLAAGLLLGWLSVTPSPGYRVECLMLDQWFALRYRLSGSQPLDERLMLVGVDSEAVELFGKPMLFWQSELAQLIETIKSGEPAVVGVDFLISPKTANLSPAIVEQLQEEALLLGLTATEGPPVVLAEMYDISEFSVNEQGGQGYENNKIVSPHEVARDLVVREDGTSPSLGLVNIPIDEDGTVRRLKVFERRSPDGTVLASNFAFKMLEAATGRRVEYSGVDSSEPSLRWGDIEVPLLFEHSFLINFPGPTEDNVPHGQARPATQTFPILSASEILKGTLAPDAFQDKLVIIGPTADSLGDHQVVPGDDNYRGPAIHLSVLNSFLTGRFLARSPAAWVAACGILALLGCFIGVSGRVVGVPIGLMGWTGFSYLLFSQSTVWMPTVFGSLAFCSGTFAGYLHRMLTVERDRAVVRSTFARMVSPQVMEHVLEDLEALNRGRRKEITVLFVDINDFTPICERHEPEEIIGMLSDYFSRMVNVIMRYDGYIKQYVGDEIMVIYGAPDESQDHATRALMTALAMREVLAQAKAEAGDKPGFYEVKIGINSGSVVVGKVGPDQRWEYAAVGDNVNLGARVMATAKKLGTDIGVSEATRRRYIQEMKEAPSDGDPIAWNSLGVQKFKGKVSEMEVFGIQRKEPL